MRVVGVLGCALLSAWLPAAAAPQRDAAWRWARAVRPNAVAPTAQQCVVLDAETFARAAPGLRDVRLMQDGKEVAYAIDISLDERASSTSPGADRAQYETALSMPARPAEWPGPGPSDRTEHPPGWFYSAGVLPAHVPVERVRLEPAPSGREWVDLSAAAMNDLAHREELHAVLRPGADAVAFTIGANLQREGDIRVGAHGDSPRITSFVLEMRRRELCFQPLSTSPLLLLFGNSAARPVRYDYAAHYQPSATPLLATMGSVFQNPDYAVPRQRSTHMTRKQRLLLASTLAALAFLFTAVPLLRLPGKRGTTRRKT